ncbi:hypothetical protein P3T37_002524 [Kitasatospora sp. MAA4]|uniref:hypothetical protein n=1 Tax=Kitasatospora sp. MAA4 TaxID=3035093 RepID=UPI002473EC44|nr:hypothetical protein [Kitasatospora sp. MAA4]MDH6133130.1 hypothetical protein [Kitasatospora sp. MAA4]
MVAVLAAGGVVTGVWWKPWQSVDLPDSACWGSLSTADYKALAGSSGKVGVAQDGEIDGPVAYAAFMGDCRLYEVGRAPGYDIVDVQVDSAETDAGQAYLAPFGDGTAKAVSFGADADGWITPSGSAVDAYLRCDYQAAIATKETANPFVRVLVSGTLGLSASSAAQVRQARVDIAWKMAKAVAHRLPCSNAVRFADAPPTVPTA